MRPESVVRRPPAVPLPAVPGSRLERVVDEQGGRVWYRAVLDGVVIAETWIAREHDDAWIMRAARAWWARLALRRRPGLQLFGRAD